MFYITCFFVIEVVLHFIVARIQKLWDRFLSYTIIVKFVLTLKAKMNFVLTNIGQSREFNC